VQNVADIARALEPQRVARATGIVITSLALLGLAGAFGIEAFDFFRYGIGLTVPRILVASALVGAAVLTVLWTTLEPRRRAPLTVGASGLLVLAVDELAAVHERLDGTFGFLVNAGAAFLVAVTLLPPAPSRLVSMLSGAAAVAWLAGHVLRFSPAGRDSLAETLGGLVIVAAAVLFLLAVVVAVRDLLPRADERAAFGEGAVVALLAGRGQPLRLAVVVAFAIAALAAAGALVASGEIGSKLFNLNREETPAAYFSAALLFAAAGLAYLARSATSHPRACLTLAIVAAGLGFDEIMAMHEKFELKFDVWGQLALLPLAAVGFVAWAMLLRDLASERTAVVLFIASPLAWVVSQGVDWFFRPGRGKDEVGAAIVFEETLEMLGSTCMFFAFLLAIRAWYRRGRFDLGAVDALAEPAEVVFSSRPPPPQRPASFR
jgi:hypothetical protein